MTYIYVMFLTNIYDAQWFLSCFKIWCGNGNFMQLLLSICYRKAFKPATIVSLLYIIYIILYINSWLIFQSFMWRLQSNQSSSKANQAVFSPPLSTKCRLTGLSGIRTVRLMHFNSPIVGSGLISKSLISWGKKKNMLLMSHY